MSEEFQGFPVFRSLQKPLEFLGLRGRFMGIAAATVIGTILCYFALSFLVGQGMGAGIAIAILSVGLVSIYTKQKEGLHHKRKFRGIVRYRNLWRNHF